MRIRVQRPEWLRGFAAAVSLSLLFLSIQAIFSEIRPGNAWGRTWGTGAALLITAAALLGVRRRRMRSGWGKTQDWVQLHVYGGALAAFLTLMHTGLRWPRSGLTAWLLALTLWVTASGLAGVALRRWIPRLLASALSLEVLYERIPELCTTLRRRAEAAVAPCSGPLRDFYHRRLAPAFAAPRVRWSFLFDITGGIERRLREFTFLRSRLTADEQERLDELEALYRTKLELDAHFTLQKPLRGWLYSHVPASLVLLLLMLTHIVSVLFY
jgi:hypothetical protein